MSLLNPSANSATHIFHRKVSMLRQLCLIISTATLVACASAPYTPPKIENERTYNIPADEIVTILGKDFQQFAESTSSRPIRIEVENLGAETSKPGVAIIVNNYVPKDTGTTECVTGKHGGWANKYNGLHYGKLGILLTPIDKKTTTVRVRTSFHETHMVNVAGKVIATTGRENLYDIAQEDWGSTCYSNGSIERSVFDIIEKKLTVKSNSH